MPADQAPCWVCLSNVPKRRKRQQGHFDTLDQVAAEAGLSAQACERLAKARRVLNAMQALAAEVLARARSPDGLWGTFSLELQAELESRARQCADIFQRSSSCVEGRNGQLSLRHHALHHLTARKLQALTVLHNYAAERADGSTAASRFYGAQPQDLFEWLLKRLTLPARPRTVRQSA